MKTLSMKLLLGLSVLAIAACGDDSSPGNDSGSDSTGTTSSPGTTSGSSGPAVTSSTGTPGSTGNDSTGMPGSSGSSGPGGSSDSTGPSGSGSSGGPADCIDSAIGSVVGAAVEAGSIAGAGDDIAADCGRAPGSEDYVVSWTAPADGTYTFSLEGSNFDTTLALIDATCGGATLGCNDDCVGLTSSLVLDASAGDVMLIVIEGFDGRTGDFTLGIFEGDVEECEFGGSGDSGFSDTGVAFIDPPPP